MGRPDLSYPLGKTQILGPTAEVYNAVSKSEQFKRVRGRILNSKTQKRQRVAELFPTHLATL